MRLRIQPHRPKLQNVESLCAQSDATLPIEHGPSGIETDGNRDYRHERGSENEADGRKQQVESAFCKRRQPRTPKSAREDEPAWMHGLQPDTAAQGGEHGV